MLQTVVAHTPSGHDMFDDKIPGGRLEDNCRIQSDTKFALYPLLVCIGKMASIKRRCSNDVDQENSVRVNRHGAHYAFNCTQQSGGRIRLESSSYGYIQKAPLFVSKGCLFSVLCLFSCLHWLSLCRSCLSVSRDFQLQTSHDLALNCKTESGMILPTCSLCSTLRYNVVNASLLAINLFGLKLGAMRAATRAS